MEATIMIVLVVFHLIAVVVGVVFAIWFWTRVIRLLKKFFDK